MKKIMKLLYVFLLAILFLGINPVNAETAYKIYTIGEKITAQLDDKGHTGDFIVIENSDSKSDEVVVVQQNGGLDATLKALKIQYDSTGDFDITTNDAFLNDLKVTNAEVRTATTFGYDYTKAGRLIVLAPTLFNGYIRTSNGNGGSTGTLAKKIGIMTEADWENLDKDAIKKALGGQYYWLSDGAAFTPPTFTDGDTYTIDSANNKFVAHTAAGDIDYSFNDHYVRLVEGNVVKTGLSSTELTNTKYEPMIYITLCKKDIVTPDIVNPSTADMNIVMLMMLGLLSGAIIIISTKKVLSI